MSYARRMCKAHDTISGSIYLAIIMKGIIYIYIYEERREAMADTIS
jgi:hypothetical protein